jgi:hypothetical protein
MIERVRQQHDLAPQRLAGDSAYGSAEMLDWLVTPAQTIRFSTKSGAHQTRAELQPKRSWISNNVTSKHGDGRR